MATTINAGTATSGAAISADTTGILQLQSGSTPTTAVTINTGGQVNFPKQPKFYATLTSGNTATSGTIIYNNAVFNIGSGYSTSTGIFTAPIAGYYQFSVSSISASSTYVETEVLYNNAMVFNIRGSAPSSGTQAGASGTFIYYMNANDTMKCNVAGSYAQFGGGPYTTFSGTLIG